MRSWERGVRGMVGEGGMVVVGIWRLRLRFGDVCVCVIALCRW